MRDHTAIRDQLRRSWCHRQLLAVLRLQAAMTVACVAIFAQQPTGHALPEAQRQVGQALSLPERELPDAYVNFPFSASVAATGGTGTYTVLLRSSLPNGLRLESAGGTVAITGVPSSWGTYPITVSVQDSSGTNVTRDYLLRVQPALLSAAGMSVVVNVTEGLKIGDADTPFFPAKMIDTEGITTTDVDLIFFPLKELIAEGIHVTDAVSVFGPAQVIIAEAIKTTDNVAVSAKLNISPSFAPAGTYNSAYSQTFLPVGNTGAVTFTPSGTLPTGLSFNTSPGSVKITGTPTQVGSFPFTLSATDSANTSTINYTLLINQASQTISIGAIPSVTYGGSNFSLSASSSSGLPVTITSTSGLAFGTNPFGPLAAGSATFLATQAGNTNYLAATSVPFTVPISPAILNVTANNANRVFDQPNPTFGYIFGSFVNGDTSSVVSGLPTTTTRATPVSAVTGSPYPIGVSVGTLAAANYSFNFISGSLTITKAPQAITLYPLANLTHGTTFPLSARASSGLPVTYAVTGPATITNNILSITGTGTVQITASQPGNGNYNAATSIVRSFTAQ